MFPAIEKQLLFSLEEYQGRIAALRRHMQGARLDALVVSAPENIYYLSGYQTIAYMGVQFLVVPLDGKPYLVLRYMESMLAAAGSCIDTVLTWEDVEDPVDVLVRSLEERRLTERRIGIEEKAVYLTVATWRRLSDALPGMRDGSGLVERCRATKSPQEIRYMREAARLTDLGMQAAVDEAREGRSENDIAAAAFAAMARAGSEYLVLDPIVTSGPRSGVPHTTYCRRTLARGDAILLEYSGVYNRYYAPLMRGLLIGGPEPKVECLAAICIEGLQAAMAAIRPGVTAGEVDAAARRVIDRHGVWENYRKRAGYSVGIGFTTWMEGLIMSVQADSPVVLTPGMCFHLPIALRLYGEAGLGFSETVLVTETGCEPLGRFPAKLFVC